MGTVPRQNLKCESRIDARRRHRYIQKSAWVILYRMGQGGVHKNADYPSRNTAPPLSTTVKDQRMQRGRLGNFLAIVEIRTKVVSVSSFLLGTLFSMRCLSTQGIGRVHWGRALGMFLATLCVDMGTTAWNTYFDYLRGTDDPRINREPDKVLIHGMLPPSYAFWTAFWLYIAAMVGGFILSLQVGLWILPVGAVCMVVGFFYNAGPLPISHTPLGELFAGGFLGSGLFLISWGVQMAGRIGPGVQNVIWYKV